MAYRSVYKGVIFIEGDCSSGDILGTCDTDLSFSLGAQLKSLRDIKDIMVENVHVLGGNAVINFTYGQKSRWLAIDDMAFWGKGKVTRLPNDVYDKILQENMRD